MTSSPASSPVLRRQPPPYHSAAWHQVIGAFARAIADRALEFDVILAGIETGSIRAALAFTLDRPSVFVRKQPKRARQRRRVEGGEVAGKRVLLIEDLITTGGSGCRASTRCATSAAVIACLAISATVSRRRMQRSLKTAIRC
ncbi:MAG: hypothetical protein U0703_16275 [Anaerolineae bacterium]